MLQILVYLIVFLGIINALRMAVYFILGNIYDIKSFKTKKITKKYTPLVSIVVPAYNEEKSIRKCLESIYESSYKKFEVIVMNDGSNDRTGKVVSEFIKETKAKKIQYYRQKNSGKAIALNNAIKKFAKGSLVMSLDADSIIDKKAIENTVKYFTDKKIVGVASNVKILNNNTILGTIQHIEYILGYKLKKAYTVLNNEYIIGGIGSTFRKKTLEKINYYDTDTITEDIDLTMKILSMGNKENKIVYASDVVCYTQPVPSIKSLFKQRFRWKYGRFQTLWKNKNLFFNRSNKYSKLLTFFQLPFVIYSELTFLVDPLLIGFLIFISIKYRDVATYQDIFLFIGFYVVIAVLSEDMTMYEKIQCLLLAPLSYIFFFVISIVEYATLIKCILDKNGIFHAKEINKCNWEHVERIVVKYS